MNNDPELNGKYLGTITKDFVKVAEHLKEASYQVRKREFSSFPIFPVCKEEQPLGQMLYGRKELDLDWNYYISYMEDFIDRKVIDKGEEFKKAYKDPDEFCCLFVIDKEFTNFIFVPYPEE